MQNRKNVLAVFVLLLTLTLFFSSLPLYASSMVSSMNSSGSTVEGNTDNGSRASGVLEEAAGAARDAVDDVVDGVEDGVDELLPNDGSADTTIPGQNTAPGTDTSENLPDDPGNTDNPNVGGTLGDTDGDGSTVNGTNDDALISDGGFSWGWFLHILLAAAVIIVIILLCMPRRG